MGQFGLGQGGPGQGGEFRGHFQFSTATQSETHSQCHDHAPSYSDEPPDTMVRLPTPPPQNFPSLHQNPGGPPRGLSQTSDESWSPADSLNFRGHMTNKDPSGSRPPRNQSRESRDDDIRGDPPGNRGAGVGNSASNLKGSAASVHSNRSAPPSILPPVQENIVMSGPAHSAEQNRDQDHAWYRNTTPHHTETIAMHNLHHFHQSSLPHSHSPSSSPPPSLPTSLPPPLSIPPQHTQSMDQILQSGPGPGRTEPRHGTHSQQHAPRTGPDVGLHHVFSQPVLQRAPQPPRVPENRPPSPVYAEPHHPPKKGGRAHRKGAGQDHTHQDSRGRAWPSSSSRQQPPPLSSHQSQPIPSVSLPDTRGLPSHPHSRSVSMEQTGAQPPTAAQSRRQNIKEALSLWKQEQEARERAWEVEQKGKHLMPAHRNGFPLSAQPMDTSGQGVDTSQHSNMPYSGQQHSAAPPVKIGPPVAIRPPKPLRSGSLPRHPKLEGIYNLDPRKPKRRQGKVPGAVWKQMPMSGRVESESSEGSETEDSGTSSGSDSATDVGDNASMYSEYV